MTNVTFIRRLVGDVTRCGTENYIKIQCYSIYVSRFFVARRVPNAQASGLRPCQSWCAAL